MICKGQLQAEKMVSMVERCLRKERISKKKHDNRIIKSNTQKIVSRLKND